MRTLKFNGPWNLQYTVRILLVLMDGKGQKVNQSETVLLFYCAKITTVSRVLLFCQWSLTGANVPSTTVQIWWLIYRFLLSLTVYSWILPLGTNLRFVIFRWHFPSFGDVTEPSPITQCSLLGVTHQAWWQVCWQQLCSWASSPGRQRPK